MSQSTPSLFDKIKSPRYMLLLSDIYEESYYSHKPIIMLSSDIEALINVSEIADVLQESDTGTE